MARKPLVGTVAENVRRHGTGGINVEACRLDAERSTGWGGGGSAMFDGGLDRTGGDARPTDGRWPANVCLDKEAAAMLDEQAGPRGGGLVAPYKRVSHDYYSGSWPDSYGGGHDAEPGAASRFFYVAKASRAEREEGCRSLPPIRRSDVTGLKEDSAGQNNPRSGMRRLGEIRNGHPTVKPIELMRWLVRLVTPPGGHVLDPFTGSGTTGIACDLEGFEFTGIELDPEYAKIAEARLDYFRRLYKQTDLPLVNA